MTSLPDSARTVLESPALAHLVTLNPDGSPQVSVVWVGLDGDEVVAGHLPEHRKVRNIRNDSRVALDQRYRNPHLPSHAVDGCCYFRPCALCRRHRNCRERLEPRDVCGRALQPQKAASEGGITQETSMLVAQNILPMLEPVGWLIAGAGLAAALIIGGAIALCRWFGRRNR